MNEKEFITSEKLCVFLDILGFSEAVVDTALDASGLLEKFTFYVRQAMEKYKSITAYYLSDSAFIIAPSNAALEFVKAIRYIVGQSFASGVMVRGGAAFGKVGEDFRDYQLENCCKPSVRMQNRKKVEKNFY